MKKLLGIVVLGLLLSGNAYSEETRLICTHEKKKPRILTFNIKNKSAKEYFGPDPVFNVFRYVAVITDENLFFKIDDINRTWNINRYSGAAFLSYDGKIIHWNCKKGSKKF